MKHKNLVTLNKSMVLVVMLATLLVFQHCKSDKDDVQPLSTTAGIALDFLIDGKALLFDTLNYINDAGNTYSITNLQFYISGLEFENVSGAVYKTDTVIYVDVKSKVNTHFNLPGLPLADYKSVKFFIGVDSLHNVDNGLPNTVQNNNMAWPTGMGGGYHVMKLEGNFIDSTSTFGYAMHLGTNKHRVAINIINDFKLSATAHQLKLVMNINEWYRNPNVYNFNTDGNYTMHNNAAMTKLSENGVDVFKIN
jgi:hypothetical protein